MYKTYFLLAISLLFGQITIAQESVSLKDLDLSHAWQEYGIAQKGRSVTGEPAKINGTVYPDVIGVQAKSIIKIKLDKGAERITSQIGVAQSSIDPKKSSLTVIPLVDGTKLYFDQYQGKKQFMGLTVGNEKIEAGSVQFTIKADGKIVFHSGIIKGGDNPEKVDLSLAGVNYLELIVEDANDGASGDHALWIEPKIIYNTFKPQLVDVAVVGAGPEMDKDISRHLIGKIKSLPVKDELLSTKTNFDWLLTPQFSKSTIYASEDGKSITMANAMVSRTFRIFPNLATVDITNRMSGESMIRAVSSEGTVFIDGKRWHIGGLQGQQERGYFKYDWLKNLKTIPESFLVEDFEIKPIEERLEWQRKRWALNKAAAKGQQLIFTLHGTGELSHVKIKLYFSIYDHIPVISKRMEVVNESNGPINIDSFQLEYLAFSEPESPGGGDPSSFRLPNIHIESDLAAGGGFTEKQTDITENWVSDKDYTSQRNYPLQTPCILKVAPKLGPNYTLDSKQVFTSFTVYEMPFDSDDRERKGLFTRRMYRTIAPWTTENPIFMHLTSTDPKIVHRAIDQCDSTGYEMIILSFGSGLNAEDTTETNIAKFKGFVDYAQSKGIDMGCYSLLASRWISDSVDVINPKTGKRGGMTFGSSPCLASDWGYSYFDKIKYFFEKTGMKCFEHDGSYPGDFCASTSHAHHRGLEDSQWQQFKKVTALYHWMSSQGIYMNVPDFYFLNGSNKVGIGYREANWSLPRDRQLIHARQLNYDCTWERIPSSLWSFVPLVEYQGGGSEATLEPLHDHLNEYKMHMIQNYGAGVQACYRGPRLYDAPQTKAVVIDVIKWYKKYRNILNSDIIHLRKPDAKDWDGMMHVNPDEKEKGLALFYNPTDQVIVRKVRLPLYYTGLNKHAFIREQEGKSIKYTIDRDYSVELSISIPANGYTWYVVQEAL